jgi:hypothetical protein
MSDKKPGTYQPGERTINEIVTDLSREIPEGMLETKKQGGIVITYVPWHEATRLLDAYAPGWTFEVVREDERVVQQRNGQDTRILSLIVRLSIPTAHGIISREQSGIEQLTAFSGYGDPYSNAMSMALRRAAAMFGLGRYLYRKGEAA